MTTKPYNIDPMTMDAGAVFANMEESHADAFSVEYKAGDNTILTIAAYFRGDRAKRYAKLLEALTNAGDKGIAEATKALRADQER